MTNTQYIAIGEAGGAHGQKGELRVHVLTEFPERFQSGVQVYIEGAPYVIESSRLFKETAIIKLHGIDNLQEAGLLRGKSIEIPECQRKKLSPGRYYHHDIIGLEVWTITGTPVGKVSDILNTGCNDIYVVTHNGKELLIPAVKEVVKDIDLPGKRITIEAIEGLLG